MVPAPDNHHNITRYFTVFFNRQIYSAIEILVLFYPANLDILDESSCAITSKAPSSATLAEAYVNYCNAAWIGRRGYLTKRS